MRGQEYIDRNLVDIANKSLVPDSKTFAKAAGMSDGYVNAIHFEKTGFLEGVLVNDYTKNGAPIAVFIEKGTVPHDIEGDPLAFPGKTSINTPTTIFTRKVHHPGTDPKNIMENAAKFAKPRFQQTLAKKTSKFLQESRAA